MTIGGEEPGVVLKTGMVLLVAVLLASVLAGCGGGSPTSVVNGVISAYRTGNAAQGRTFFATPGLYDAFVSFIPKGTTLSVDSVTTSGDTANAEVSVSPVTDISGYKLVLRKTGGSWKVVDFKSP
jgi:hypothetical protein